MKVFNIPFFFIKTKTESSTVKMRCSDTEYSDMHYGKG